MYICIPIGFIVFKMREILISLKITERFIWLRVALTSRTDWLSQTGRQVAGVCRDCDWFSWRHHIFQLLLWCFVVVRQGLWPIVSPVNTLRSLVVTSLLIDRLLLLLDYNPPLEPLLAARVSQGERGRTDWMSEGQDASQRETKSFKLSI